jgi:dolichyl-phosphate-mannose-protein mannosyltransferase
LTAIELERRALRTRNRLAELAIAVPAWIWLSLLVAISVVIRSALAFRDPAPWIFQDELLYSELAKSFAATGHFAVRDSPTPIFGGFGVVYPTLISPAWALFSKVPAAYDAAKAINAFIMSLAAVPVYLLARRLAGRAMALAAAVLTLALPGMVYTSTIMTENAFFPVFLFCVLALVLALERPTALRQLAAVALTFVAYMTRNQGAVLVPALVTAIVIVSLLEAWGDDRGFAVALGRRAAAFAVTWATLAAGIGGYLAFEVGSRGQTVSSAVLGGYSVLTESSYSVQETARWFLYHAGELDLAVGVLPFAAFIVLVVAALRRRPPSRETRIFAAVALSVSVWLLLEVAAFATTAYGHQIQERNLFYLEPLFLIALVAWAGGILLWSRTLTGAGALVAAALPGVVPYSSFLGPNEVANAFGLLPLWRAVDRAIIAPSHLTEVVLLAAMAAGLLFLLLPRRLALVAPAVVLVYLAAANSPVVGKTRLTSAESRHGGVQTQRDWIDRAVGTKPRVSAIWTDAPGLNFVTLWDNEFFNRSVGPVHNLQGPPDGLPQERITIDPRSGLAHDPSGKVVGAQYVLTDRSLKVAGQVIAQDPGLGMVLYRVGGPVRLIVRKLGGVYQDSWSGPAAGYTRYPCVSGTLSVVLTGWAKLQPQPITVVARSAGRVRRIVVPPTAQRTLAIPLRPRNKLCRVAFSISPTVVPAHVLGGGDTRVLGIRFKQVTFSPKP